MKIPAIKALVEQATPEQLKAAIEAIENGEAPAIEVQGVDEGEQLTHALAALWIHEQSATNGTSTAEELRNYTQKVRNSIKL